MQDGRRPRLARSYGGCATCRFRRVKCDETKPSCVTCQNASLECGGYENRILFDNDFSGHNSLFRRPLFTESQRKHMSQCLVRSAAPKHIFTILSKLDERYDDASQQSTWNEPFQDGPFGVFKVDSSYLQKSCQSDAQVNSDLFSDLLSASEIHTTDVLQFPDMDIIMPSDNDFLTLFPSDNSPLQEFSSDSNGIQQCNPISHSLDGQDAYPRLNLESDLNFVSGLRQRVEDAQLRSLSIPSPHVDTSNPDEVSLLLSRYKDFVIPLLSPLKGHKSPCHVLFLPLAMQTLAALTINQKPSRASLSILYSVLSISALSMRGSPSSQEWEHWNKKALQFLSEAQIHLDLTMPAAFYTPKTDKYKTILAALLSMIQALVFAGTWEHSELYLLEAEKFIRLKGLVKPRKSRKVRLLSHCYGYMRLFYESTFVLVNSSYRNELIRSIQQAGIAAPGQDSISFRLGKWRSDLKEKMLEPKTSEEGENDLHLETPGLWQQTLFSDIYDIPESFLALLSQVIRLANEKAHSDEMSDPPPLSLREFTIRAQALESCIREWIASSSDLASTLDKPHETVNRHDRLIAKIHHMLQKALLIYFYRRVHEIDATLLEHYSVQVKEYLFQCAEIAARPIGFTSIFVWSAFTASCEAINPDLQNNFLTWFENNAASGSIEVVSFIVNVIKQVWKRRGETSNNHLSWPDVLKEDNLCIFYY